MQQGKKLLLGRAIVIRIREQAATHDVQAQGKESQLNTDLQQNRLHHTPRRYAADQKARRGADAGEDSENTESKQFYVLTLALTKRASRFRPS
jgi:hypothetical protein